MLTIKIFGQKDQFPCYVISAQQYFVLNSSKFTDIYCYATEKQEKPILVTLTLDEEVTEGPTYYEAFIENASGKTIDRRRAPTLPK